MFESGTGHSQILRFFRRTLPKVLDQVCFLAINNGGFGFTNFWLDWKLNWKWSWFRTYAKNCRWSNIELEPTVGHCLTWSRVKFLEKSTVNSVYNFLSCPTFKLKPLSNKSTWFRTQFGVEVSTSILKFDWNYVQKTKENEGSIEMWWSSAITTVGRYLIRTCAEATMAFVPAPQKFLLYQQYLCLECWLEIFSSIKPRQ